MPLSCIETDSVLLPSCCDLDLVQTLEGGDFARFGKGRS
jgi:hypothetical protein